MFRPQHSKLQATLAKHAIPSMSYHHFPRNAMAIILSTRREVESYPAIPSPAFLSLLTFLTSAGLPGQKGS